jgi:hypothetical protein
LIIDDSLGPFDCDDLAIPFSSCLSFNDFNDPQAAVFPDRMKKTTYYGFSLMDIGVGSFVMTAAARDALKTGLFLPLPST